MPEALTEGERWTRSELRRLLDARFAPRAVGRFLAASFIRSADVRRQRPELARQSRRWMATGAAAYALTPTMRHPSAAAWWAATALMLDWHLGMLESPDGNPRPLGPADALTLTRAWLVPVAANDPTPLVCGAAGLTDVLDGRLARATTPTRAGRDLEPLVDACFAAAALRGLRKQEKLPRGVTKAEAARLAIGFGYALATYFGRAQRPHDDVLHAARATTALRVAGITAAAANRRRLGTALLATGCAAGLAALLSGSRASSRARSATRGA